MRRTIPGLVSILSLLLLCAARIPALGQDANPAQTPTSQGPTAPPKTPKIEHPGVPRERNPPDMVCFGYYPNWSLQFANGEARYVGYNEPDRYFDGAFYWVAEESAWEWHRQDGLLPANGSYGLSATIEKTACQDPVKKTTTPYSAEVYLPEGDMVSGCCRKLKPGEAVIGPHGAPQNAATQGTTAPAAAQSTTPPPSNTPPVGHPVDQY